MKIVKWTESWIYLVGNVGNPEDVELKFCHVPNDDAADSHDIYKNQLLTNLASDRKIFWWVLTDLPLNEDRAEEYVKEIKSYAAGEMFLDVYGKPTESRRYVEGHWNAINNGNYRVIDHLDMTDQLKW